MAMMISKDTLKSFESGCSGKTLESLAFRKDLPQLFQGWNEGGFDFARLAKTCPRVLSKLQSLKLADAGGFARLENLRAFLMRMQSLKLLTLEGISAKLVYKTQSLNILFSQFGGAENSDWVWASQERAFLSTYPSCQPARFPPSSCQIAPQSSYFSSRAQNCGV
jgi:hypothetical protein